MSNKMCSNPQKKKEREKREGWRKRETEAGGVYQSLKGQASELISSGEREAAAAFFAHRV